MLDEHPDREPPAQHTDTRPRSGGAVIIVAILGLIVWGVIIALIVI